MQASWPKILKVVAWTTLLLSASHSARADSLFSEHATENYPAQHERAKDAAAELPKDLKGKIVRHIQIVVEPVFDEPDKGWLYRTANNLKIETKRDTIKRELLFHEGAPADRFSILESERVLRALGYLRNVRIVPKIEGEFVDITVYVQDTWTFIPQLNISAGSGKNSRSVGLSESDVLGYGKRAELLYAQDDNRDIIEGVVEDPRLWGGEESLLAGYFNRSDGQRSVFSIGKPYRSLLDRGSWSLDSDISDTVGRLFRNGDERYIFRQKKNDIQARYSVLQGNPEVSARRYTFGYHVIDDTFDQSDRQDYEALDLDPKKVSNDPAQLPFDRRFSGPTFAFDLIHPDFISMNYIDRFDRVEDYNLGSQYDFNFMAAPSALGSDENTLLFSGNRSAGMRFSTSSFLRGEAGIASRYEEGGFTNTLARIEAKYYNVVGDKYLGQRFIGRHTLASSFYIDYGIDLDRDREFLLGADNGLRGYSARTFSGDKRMLLNLEDRVHFVDDVFSLFSLGGAVFTDVGGVTDQSFNRLISDRVYSDVGIGLRVGFPRSTGGRVVRLDLAFPLRDGPDGSNAWELRILVAGGQLFGSTLRSEDFGNEKANVAVGFDH